jgi:argininosuccinate lyase
LVGKLVLHSVSHGLKPTDWTAERLAEFAPEFSGDFVRLLDPRAGIATREIPGGTGPAAVAKALDEADRRLAQWRSE